MPRKDVKLLDDHFQFVECNPINLSALIRQTLDEAIKGDRELPKRTKRNTFGHEMHHTAVAIDEDHKSFIDNYDFVFAIFVHDVIEERIEFERQLDEIDN